MGILRAPTSSRLFTVIVNGFFLACMVLMLPQPVSAEEAETSNNGLLSVAIGRLNVDQISVDSPLDYESEGALDGADWNMLILGAGWRVWGNNTFLLLEFMFTERKTLNDDLKEDPLVGGGTTKVSSHINHYGLFAGVQQRIKRFYGELGWGAIIQERSFDYDPAVINPANSSTLYRGAVFYGLGMQISPHLMLGLRRYQSTGWYDYEVDPQPPAPEMKSNVLQLSLVF